MGKKIAVVSSSSKIGGTELSALRICNLLAKKGNEVVYIAPGNMLQNEMSGVEFLPYKFSRKNPAIIVLAILSIARIIKRKHIEILHCQDAMSCILCCYAKKYLGCTARIIWHDRGIGFKSYITMSKKYSPLIDVIVCNSHFERTLLLMNRSDPKKIRVIYNAIEKQVPTMEKSKIRKELGMGETDYIVGMVGRISYEKNLQTMVVAVSEALGTIENLKLLIVGDGPEREKVEHLAEKLGISDKVVFTGFRRDIANMMHAMDVFVIPSLYESFGNVTVEAMYSKTPVITSRSGGIPEVIQNGVNGLTATAGNVKEWRDAIIYSANNTEHMKALAERAYLDAEDRYGFEKFYNLMTNVYFGND